MLQRKLNWMSRLRRHVTEILEAANEIDEVLREHDVLEYATGLVVGDLAGTAHEGTTKQQITDAVAALRVLRTWLNGANGTTLYRVKE
jgi:hypothetical protein